MRKRASSRLRDGYADKPSSPMRKAIQTTAATRMKRTKSHGLMLNSSAGSQTSPQARTGKTTPQQDDDDREQDRANRASDWNGDDQDEQGGQEPDRDPTERSTFHDRW
jgi:hypothetical protein